MEILRQGKVNLLDYGLNRLHVKQKQKNNITKFWPTSLFLIRYFLLLEQKRSKT